MVQVPRNLEERTPPMAESSICSIDSDFSAEIIVYICPTPGCNSHYAAPDFRPDRANIERIQYARNQNDGKQTPSHNRIECPTCRTTRGVRVQRVPYIVTSAVPLDTVIEAMRSRDERAETTT